MYRRDFSRMMEDCKSHNLEIILTKSIGRFSKDTFDTLEALNQLKTLGIRVILEQESKVLKSYITENVMDMYMIKRAM